jgi:hypothetical protein
MKHPRGLFYTCVVLAMVGGSGAARGQGLSEALGALASKSGSFSDDDRQEIRTAIEGQFSAIASAASGKDQRDIRGDFEKVWAGGSLDFKDAFARQLSAAVEANLDQDDVGAVAMMMQLLADTGHEGAIDGMIGGLKSTHAAVRLIALSGISAQMGTEGSEKVVQAFGELGPSESSWVVTRALYSALGQLAVTKATTDAQIKTLESRVANYAKHRGGWGAEIEVIEFLKANVGGLGEGEKVRVAKALGKVLAVVVPDYAKSVGDEVRMPFDQAARTATLIYAAEDLLAAMGIGGATTPKLGEALGKPGEQAGDALLFELNRWIGTSDVDGALNAAPWNVPKGGGV